MPRKNNHLRALFFILVVIIFEIDIVVGSETVTENKCVTEFCGKNKSLPIHYPFKLEGGEHQTGCDKNRAINLKCSNQESVPVLSLPSSGEFYIRNVNYSSQIMQLYDPNNCLPGRIMNTNFSSSPLIALDYENYTFFSFRSNYTDRSNFTAIVCLSNPTFSILSTSLTSRAQEMSNLGCNMIITVPVPVSSPLQYEYNGFQGDLLLTWNIPACEICVRDPRLSKGLFVAMLVVGIVIMFLAYPIVYIFTEYSLRLVILKFICSIKRKLVALASRARVGSVRQDQLRLPVVAARPHRVDIDRAVNTIVVGESRRVPGPNTTVCPICLEDYNPRDTIKCSINCEHYFHESCIDLWLRTHNSCPICRTATP